MQLAHAQAIVEELTQTLGVEASVREDYSGRGMYGRTTAAVSTHYSEDVVVAPTSTLTAWAWARWFTSGVSRSTLTTTQELCKFRGSLV